MPVPQYKLLSFVQIPICTMMRMNTSSFPVMVFLDNITISDNHGGFRFPPGTTISGSLTVARSAQAYKQSHGRLPDFEWLDYSPDVPNVINGDPLRMANTGDELVSV